MSEANTCAYCGAPIRNEQGDDDPAMRANGGSSTCSPYCAKELQKQQRLNRQVTYA